MKHYEEGAALTALLEELVERHPIHADTAEGWFEIAHKLLDVAYVIRRDAWQALPHEGKRRLIAADPKLHHVDAVQ